MTEQNKTFPVNNNSIIINAPAPPKQKYRECNGKGGFYIEGVMWLGDREKCKNTGEL